MEAAEIRLGLNVPAERLAGFRFSCVPGEGPIPCAVAIVGEAPGEEEEKRHLPFVGLAGQLLDLILQKSGVERAKLYVTNVCKFRPVDESGATRSPTAAEILVWAPYLLEEIDVVKPSLVVLLGNTALKALYPDSKQITKERGVFRQHPLGFTTIATFHPSGARRQPALRPVLEGDIALVGRYLSGDLPDASAARKRRQYLIATVEEAQKLLLRLKLAESFSFDLETRSLDWKSEPILCISFSCRPGESYVVPFVGEGLREFWSPEDKKAVMGVVGEILACDVPKGGQNWKFDVEFLEHNGFPVANLSFDTLLEHHLLNENSPHNLAFMVQSELGGIDHHRESQQYLQSRKTTFDVIPERVLWKRAGLDADYTQEIHEVLSARLGEEEPQSLSFYKNVLIPLQRVLTNVEMRGVLVDRARLVKLRTQYVADLKEIQEAVEQEIGRSINLNSPTQLRKLFFEERNNTAVKRTAKGNVSTDDEVLRELARTDEVARVVLDHRTKSKLVSTFLTGIETRLTDEDRVHPSYSVSGTVTWRLSCRDPNLQNPPDTIRNIFVAPPGYVFIGADYSQIELLVVAVLAGEQRLVDLYNKGGDLHKHIAAATYGIKVDDVTPEQRKAIKFVVYGLNYGRGAWSLAQQLEISAPEAQEVIDAYFRRFSRIKEWRERTQAFAERYGYVESPFGFRRHLDFSIAKNDAVARGELLRQAVNSPIQGTAATITNVATIKLEKELSGSSAGATINMTLHDALYFYAPREEWKECVATIRSIMEAPVVELGGICPRVSVEVGEYWGGGSLLQKDH